MKKNNHLNGTNDNSNNPQNFGTPNQPPYNTPYQQPFQQPQAWQQAAYPPRQNFIAADQRVSLERDHHKPSKSKRRWQFKWYDAIILLVALIMFSSAAYYFISSRATHEKQKKISAELYDLVPVEQQVDPNNRQGIYVDPDANKVAGEQWEVFSNNGESYPKGKKVLIQPIGRLQISSIDLSLPILSKAGLIELRYGIGHHQTSAPLYGDSGLSVLFGHHMIEKGHYFNRLDEVEIGAEVKVLGNNKEYTYKVDKRLIVQPQEIVPLIKEKTADKYILMITCVNPPSFDQRLLVYAKLTDVKDLTPPKSN